MIKFNLDKYLEQYFIEIYRTLLQDPATAPWIYSLPQALQQVKEQWLLIPQIQEQLKQINQLSEFEIKASELSFVLQAAQHDPQQLELGQEIYNTNIALAQYLTIKPQTDIAGLTKRIQFLANLLKPWRKGPFQLDQLTIDAEWRSDLKWQLLQDQFNFTSKKVLDIGSSNGYHLWCYLQAQAELVVGVEPYWLFIMQHLLIKKLLANNPVQDKLLLIPSGVEALTANPQFDLVLSMGVLYHRKDPIQHLRDLRSFLALKPELGLTDNAVILETIIQDTPGKATLFPLNTYAKMPNVHSIPSYSQLVDWLTIAGYKEIKLIQQRPANNIEQRATSWIDDPSYLGTLDPNNPQLTCEGYPAPHRVIIAAK